MIFRLQEILREKKIKNVELAHAIGCTPVSVSHMINGRTMPSIKTLAKIAEYANVPIWQFFIDPNSEDFINASCADANKGNDNVMLMPAVSHIPDFDIIGHIIKQKRGTEVIDPKNSIANYTIWHYIEDDALEPYYMKGDGLGLMPYLKGGEVITQGKLYAVDTNSNGLIIRYVYVDGDRLILRSSNQIKYPDVIIEKSDIIRVYRPLIMYRV